jgi:hypothetical protein
MRLLNTLDTWVFPLSLRQLAAASRQLLLLLEKLEPGCGPFFTGSRHVVCHTFFSLLRYHSLVPGHELNLTPEVEMMGVTSVAGFRHPKFARLSGTKAVNWR